MAASTYRQVLLLASPRAPDQGRAEGPYRAGLKVMAIPDGRNFTVLTWAA